MLSSDTLQRTQGSFAFQEKSEILAVWPPWMNYNISKEDKWGSVHNNLSEGENWNKLLETLA